MDWAFGRWCPAVAAARVLFYSVQERNFVRAFHGAAWAVLAFAVGVPRS